MGGPDKKQDREHFVNRQESPHLLKKMTGSLMFIRTTLLSLPIHSVNESGSIKNSSKRTLPVAILKIDHQE